MKLYETLDQHLKTEPNYVTDNGELKKWVVINKAQNYDSELIGLLLASKELKTKFFLDVKGILVFNQALFIQFLEQKNYLNDSYTEFKNKVGLNIDGKYLKQRNEVSLVWPFKDCILEGGQSREEDKREEIFFNETLAQDEISQLLEPKVLTNGKRYTAKGEKPLTTFNRNDQGTITDNLVLKGNNLLALHTIREQFAGKIKLIYIDPPYNTGGDSFQYNDSFNHSTWLTFMKNRLEIAKTLLKKEGVLFIQIDERELAYLKVMADEVFNRDNFVIQINWQRTTQRTVLGQGATPIINIVEYILCYVNDISSKDAALNKIQKIIPSNDKMYNQYNLMMKTEGERVLFKTLNHNEQEIKIYKHKNFKIESIPSKTRSEEYYIKNFEFIVRKDSQQQESSLEQLIMSNIQKNDTLFSVERILRQGKRKGELNKSYYMNDNVIYHLKKYADVIDNTIFRKVDMNNLWLDYEISSAGIAEEGGVKLKRGKKPEQLIKRIIEIGTTEESDIVLDYHLGSGTTCAVAHKMGRQYIGIEQLDYGDNDSVVRLKEVVKGDGSGISKTVNWKGGGEFIYFELKKYNENYIEQIQKAKDTKALLKIWNDMKAHSFINYNVDLSEQDKHLEEFKKLAIAKQKRHLVELLDKNQLYVNRSSVNDKDFQISSDEKKITREFYQTKDK